MLESGHSRRYSRAMTDSSTANPLLAPNHALPDFGAIRAEHVEPAVRDVLDAQRRALGAAETATPSLDWLRNLEQIGRAHV